MKKLSLLAIFLSLILSACQNEADQFAESPNHQNEILKLGRKLDNPYSVKNMKQV